jgi:urea transport system substrate-binding protein
MTSVAEGLSYESPRGTVELRDRHLPQRAFLAATHGLSWDVIQQHRRPDGGP